MLANNYSINDKRYFQLLLPAHHYLYALTTLRYLTNKYDDFRLVGWLASCVSMLLCGLTKSCITLNRSRVRRSANKALTNENKKNITKNKQAQQQQQPERKRQPQFISILINN